MVEVLDIDGYTFDKDVLRLALEEYEEFKATEEYKEAYKWEIFEELNNWFEENEINVINVVEFVEFLKEKNPQSGSFVHWSQLDDLYEFAKENPKELTELFDNLYQGQENLEDRLANFREKTGIGTPAFGYLLAAYDFEEYAPIKVDQFRDFINHFADQIPSKIGSLSVPQKYVLYHKYCHKMLEFLEKEGIVEDGTTLDAQDFYYTLESYDKVNKESIFLKYLWQFSKRFNSFRSDSNQLLEEIKSLPESFLEERRDFYEGTEKIRRIRYEVLDEWNKGEDSDIEKIKRNVDADYDTNILQAWDNFKIFGQIYVDYFKDRTKRYFESLAKNFIDEVGYEGLEYHIVTFQGIQNFVTDEPWIALFPEEKESHTESYQLFFQIQPERLRYGLLPGHDIDASYNRERDLEVIEPPFEDELLVDKILEKFENALPDFKRLNDIEAEDKTNHYWVNQKKEEEIEKGYLEAPTDGIWHHDLEKLDKSDIVFNYFDGELIGYSEVLSEQKIVEVDGQEKYRVNVEVNEFESTISISEVNDYLLKNEVKLEKHYPINKDGGVNQGYLFDLSEKAGEYLVDYQEKTIDEEDKGEPNYFWITANPDIWSVSEIEDGGEEFYTAYNKKGNKRRIFDAFKKAKPGDKVIFYEASPVKKVVAEGEVARGLYTKKEEGYDEPVQGIDIRYVEPIREISWSQITSVPELEKSQPIANRAQGSIFELTKEEYETILALEPLEDIIEKTNEEILLEKNNPNLDFEIDKEEITKGLHFPGDLREDIISSVISALKSGKHIILTGPPGTGKTKLAKNVAEAAKKENSDSVDDYIFTTATADWTTFDTMGGYQPSKEDESLEFKSGQFLKCFKENGRPVNKWLIIDEINRADIDKAFGQLFSVLSEDEVELPFTDEEERSISVKPLNGEIEEESFEYSDSDYYVTRNWRLLATMNTFDKASLYEMSYAFMRRFAFIDVGVPTEEFEDNDELINDYIGEWDDIELEDFSEDELNDLTKVWKVLNKGKRSIGPAIIKDMLMFLNEYDGEDGLVNALKLYVLPQLEGMVKQNQKGIFEDLEGEIEHREELEKVAKERFEIELEWDENE